MNSALMVDPVQPPGVCQGAANVIAAVMLLIEFGMLRQALARDQVRLYMAQSALSAALKVVVVPLVLRRLPGRAGPEGRDEEEALGPIGKAAGYTDDARLARPCDTYPSLAVEPAREHAAGDALARLRVRWEEVDQAFALLRRVTEELTERACDPLRLPCEPGRGRAVGWAEAPQGEVLYDVALDAGAIVRCHPRSASFRNLVLMHEVFTGGILTDFPFPLASQTCRCVAAGLAAQSVRHPQCPGGPMGGAAFRPIPAHLAEMVRGAFGDLDTAAAIALLRGLADDDGVPDGARFETFAYVAGSSAWTCPVT